MKVHIEDKIYLESDDRQYVLKEYNGRFDEKGNEGYKPLGYFGKVEQALKHLIRLNVMKSEAANVSELIEDVKRIENKIENLMGA